MAVVGGAGRVDVVLDGRVVGGAVEVVGGTGREMLVGGMSVTGGSRRKGSTSSACVPRSRWTVRGVNGAYPSGGRTSVTR
jgi:hypothetical protein